MDIWTPNRERGLVVADDGVLRMLGRYTGGRRQVHAYMGRGALVYPDGTEEWEPDWQLNALADEGEQSMINVYLREQANVSKYLALLNDATIAETDTIATMVEAETPGTDGYDRQQALAAGWGVPALDAGDYQSAGAEETFGPNTGAAWALTHVAFVTVATGTSGLFLGFIPTSTSSVGQDVSYKYTPTWKLQ